MREPARYSENISAPTRRFITSIRDACDIVPHNDVDGRRGRIRRAYIQRTLAIRFQPHPPNFHVRANERKRTSLALRHEFVVRVHQHPSPIIDCAQRIQFERLNGRSCGGFDWVSEQMTDAYGHG